MCQGLVGTCRTLAVHSPVSTIRTPRLSVLLPTHSFQWLRRPPPFCPSGRASYGRSASPRERACCAGRNGHRCAPVRCPSYTPPSASPPPAAAIDPSGSTRTTRRSIDAPWGFGWNGHASVSCPPLTPLTALSTARVELTRRLWGSRRAADGLSDGANLTEKDREMVEQLVQETMKRMSEVRCCYLPKSKPQPCGRSALVSLGEPLARRRTRWFRGCVLAGSGWMQALDWRTSPVHLSLHTYGADVMRRTRGTRSECRKF